MKKECRPLQCSLFALILATSTLAWAQLEINSSPTVVGSGARALGMGGAFVAVADDATAASWNPAGLTQLERPEISMVYDWNWFSEDFSSQGHKELSGSYETRFSGLNYGSIAYPFPWTLAGRNLVFSLNYQRRYDFDRDLKFQYNEIFSSSVNIIQRNSRYEYSQRGALGALSPAFGFEITDTLAFGIAVNLWDHDLLPDNEWKTRRTVRTTSRINGQLSPTSWTKLTINEDYKNFDGTNYTFGFLYKPTDRISLGAVYHTRFTAEVDYVQEWGIQVSRSPSLPAVKTRRKQKYTFPSAVGMGVAYRFPNDKLTLSFDVTRTEWDQFIIYDARNPQTQLRRRSGITGLPKKQSPHDPTYTVRLGMEYVFVNERKPRQSYLPSLRAGLFYDPQPAGGRKSGPLGLGRVTGTPDDYFGVSLGAGVLIKNRVNIDLAYIYRWGDEVRNDTFGLAHTAADVDQHTLYLSTVIYF